MAFDGIVTKTIVNELNSCLLEGKIDKISMPNKLEIILGVYGNRRNHKLLISTHPNNGRINLTNYTKENPLKAFNFCMVLRKYLLGGKILNISSKTEIELYTQPKNSFLMESNFEEEFLFINSKFVSWGKIGDKVIFFLIFFILLVCIPLSI